jgi:hypothetical protein
MEKAIYQAIYPIGATNPMDMPVADASQAVRWYVEKMGFIVDDSHQSPTSVTISRDRVRMRLVENGRDPEQASCYIAVDNVDRARDELAATGVNVSEIRPDEYGGIKRRVFFAKDDDGLCYCLGTKIAPE